MKWTQLRAAIRARVAPALKKRLDLHQARYRRTREETGRVWLTLDRAEIASFDTESYVARRAALANEARAGVGPFALSVASNHAEYLAADEAAVALLRRRGEYDDYSALEDLEASLSWSLDRMLVAESPLIRALAVVDCRFGKRRLLGATLEPTEHALVRTLLGVRREAEGLLGASPAV